MSRARQAPSRCAACRGAYRVRVGDYRVIYTIDDGQPVVLVVDLGHRDL
ncbi:type II toxin-antitoxin system RelE family toxin [Actinokineospora sp. HUAS TT18]